MILNCVPREESPTQALQFVYTKEALEELDKFLFPRAYTITKARHPNAKAYITFHNHPLTVVEGDYILKAPRSQNLSVCAASSFHSLFEVKPG